MRASIAGTQIVRAVQAHTLNRLTASWDGISVHVIVQVSVGEICGNLMGKYPYYATHPAGSWRSSVRTTLTSGTFAQTDRDSTGVGKGVLWGITANPVDHGGAPRKKPRRVGVVEADSDVGAMSVWKQVVAPDGHGAGVGEATSSTSSEPRLLGDTTQNNSWCSRVGCTASAALIRCTTCTLCKLPLAAPNSVCAYL
jgi:hypothetical protein